MLDFFYCQYIRPIWRSNIEARSFEYTIPFNELLDEQYGY